MSDVLDLRPRLMGNVVAVTTEAVPASWGSAEPDDDEVARRFALGDDQALAWAYERWAAQIHGMAVRAFGSGPDAEDVTQQVFVAAWIGRGGFRRDGPPRLTLLTCGGPFLEEYGSYRDNVVVVAEPLR